MDLNINKLFLFSSCIIAVIADMCLVMWAKSSRHNIYYLVSGIVLNSFGMFIWTYTMRQGIESALAITAYSLLTVAGCSFLGIVVFHENVSLVNTAGLVLALIALVLVSL